MKKKLVLSLLASSLLVSSTYASDDLTNVVVTAKTQNTALDTAGSFSIITAEDIQKTSAGSLKEVLEGIVGVNMGQNSSSLNGRQNISIRGTDAKDTLILVDGERISGSDAQIGHSDFQYNWIPINAIEKIEVVRGPMSSLYGSRAIGGIINIITKKPDGNFEGSISVEGGAEASRSGGENGDFSANAGGKITDKLSIATFAQYQKRELSEQSDDSTAIEGKESTNAMVKLWYEIDPTQTLSAFVIAGKEKRDTQSYDELYDIDKYHYSVGYKKDFGDIGLNLKVYRNESDSHTEQFEYTHEMTDDIANMEIDIASFDNHYIVVGAEYRTEEYRKRYDDAADDATKGFEDKIDYKSFYFQDEIEVTDDLILTIGGRYDDHERFSGEFSPKANIVYKLSENSRLKAGYGHGFSAPTVTQNSDQYNVSIPVDFFGAPLTGVPKTFHRFHGNDNLNPETSDTFELGFEYLDNDMLFAATIFHTELKDLIQPEYQNSTFVPIFGPFQMEFREYLYVNVGKAEINGLELEFEKKKLLANIDFNFNYTFLDTENKDTGEELINRPDHTANVKLSTMLPWKIGSTLRVNYVGDQKGGTGDTIDNYTTVGLQFYKTFAQDLTLRIGAENLTDIDNVGDGNDEYKIRGQYFYARMTYQF